MKETRILMGMPIAIEIVNSSATKEIFDIVFPYFESVDNKFSTYKENSEMSLINQGKIKENTYSHEMKMVLALCKDTKEETNGYFDIFHDGKYDPSGLVKGWAIYNAVDLLKKMGIKDFFIDAGGDIQVAGKNKEGKTWSVGIRNPFNLDEIVKVVYLTTQGIATSGTYIRGQHIYNPKTNRSVTDVKSITVIGPNIYDADRFATAAFAMGKRGIQFIQGMQGFEGYMIDPEGKATYTTGFEKYTAA